MDPWTTRTDTSCWTRATAAGSSGSGRWSWTGRPRRRPMLLANPPRGPRRHSASTAGRDGWPRRAAMPEPESWVINLGDQRFELRLTDSGQVGLFPEQAANRAWIRDACAHLGGAPTVLNLFAYTGAATLAAAAAGAAVTHVDGSKPTVAWARQERRALGLDDRPIRWIVDEVELVFRRESRQQPDVRRPRARPAELRPRWAVAERRLPGGSRSGSTTSSTPARPSPAGTPRSPSCRPTRRASGRPSSPRPSLEPSGGLPAWWRPVGSASGLGVAHTSVLARTRASSADDARPDDRHVDRDETIKATVRLRDRAGRTATGQTIVDGAREIARALMAACRSAKPSPAGSSSRRRPPRMSSPGCERRPM